MNDVHSGIDDEEGVIIMQNVKTNEKKKLERRF